ncbi:uncharacterized protein LOC108091605 [Drosophila ficusphila]|uniref:uncharacterized protein LOC108091605 n=1 Tax=Drosophila ficusphila TaxID=30025 RepID=UPI0007E842C1|nr:uncharacterized protein LOC108091605 [Drosophila ficusphila]
MVNSMDDVLVTYGLLLCLPVRFFLFAVYIYLQNLAAMLQLIQDLLSLLLSILLFAASCICRLPEEGPFRVMSPPMRLLQFHLRNVGLLLHMLRESLRIQSAALGRLSWLFHFCAHRRTWVIMLQSH